MGRISFGAIVTMLISGSTGAEVVTADVFNAATLPECGSVYAGPFGDSADGGGRPCPARQARIYRSKYNGFGKRALDLESEACFVPDQSYQLLDEIVDTVRARVAQAGLKVDQPNRRELIQRISMITGEALVEKGFGLHIPTATLGEALHFRQANGEPDRHVIDCDTSSLILLEVAQSYALPAALVDITLASGSGHNYVRWQVDERTWFDWDTNGRTLCRAPAGLPSYEGRALTEDETFAYLSGVRAAFKKERHDYPGALADYRKAIHLHPEQPGPYNNVAWIIATRDFKGRALEKAYAVESARRAVALDRQGNYLDTLGCALAYAGNFAEAARVQQQAVDAEPGKPQFAGRLAMFQAPNPKDCTGID